MTDAPDQDEDGRPPSSAAPDATRRAGDPTGVDVLETTLVHRGRVFDVVRESVRLASGLRQDLDLIVHPGAVAILARDAEGRLLVVRQYRHAVRTWLEELPAGRLETGEEPLVAAQRELEEETGYRARDWRELPAFFAAPGFCTERMHLFLATGLESVLANRLAPDADEEIEVVRRTPEELARTCVDAKTLVALLRLGVADEG